MDITEIRVRLAERKRDRLRAFCSVTFDDAFVIRDVKVIQGDQGLFVAMPSRKLTDRCPSCSVKNQLRSRYCSECGARLAENRADLDDRGRPRLYVDIAHPVNAEAREVIEQAVLAAYGEEVKHSTEPGYRATPIDEEDEEEPLDELEAPEQVTRAGGGPTEEGEERPPTPQAPPPPKPTKRPHRFGEGIFEEDQS